MGALRRSRDERPARRRFRVTARDLEILRAIGRMKVATTHQVVLIFALLSSVASRRLAKLVALGCLAVAVADMNAPNLYFLTETGRVLLADAGLDEGDLHVARPAPRLDPHLRTLNDLRIALTVAQRRRNDVLTTLFLADHDLRRADGSNTYIPDAVVVIEEEGAEPVRLVVEVDLGGERASQFASKIETTVALARAGRAVWGLPHPWRPVLLAPSVARLRVLSGQITRGGGGELWIAGELGAVLRDPLGAVFATAAMIASAGSVDAVRFPGRLVHPVAP
jgi:hypothetical protein